MSKLAALRCISGEIDQAYEEMTKEFSTFQFQSGFICPDTCGKCCKNPDIEATPLEMLPMGFYLYDNNLIDENFCSKLDQSAICTSYKFLNRNGDKGFCSHYSVRPSVCRMFGVAGYKSKNGEHKLSTCKVLKRGNSEKIYELEKRKEVAPLMSTWSTKIRLMDIQLGSKYYPINQALKIVLEEILTLSIYEKEEKDRS